MLAFAILYIKCKIDSGSWFVSDVYFWTDPYMGREVFSALFVLSHTNGVRRTTGTSMGTGTGTTRRARAEGRDTNNTPPVCCCEPIAPINRALRGHLNLLL